MGGFQRATYFWTLSIIVLNSVITEGLVCYNCQNMPHPRDCGRITECSLGEECYVESRITSSGNTLYNSGCSSQIKCNAGTAGRRSLDTAAVSQRDSQPNKRSDFIVCYECCKDTSYCNREKCDQSTPTISFNNRTSCLTCPNAESPDKCEFTSFCDVHEVCYTELIRFNGEDRYRMGCLNPDACAIGPFVASANIIGKKRFLVSPRLASYCGECCKDGVGNCNRDLCRSGVTLRPDAVIGALNSPPPQQDCEDVNTQLCQDQLQKDPDSCLNVTIANYACRRTCGCTSGILNPGQDCFYESTRYQGDYRFTIYGDTCVSWKSAFQQPLTTGPGFPEENIGDAENKCRDPTGKGFPWCFTSAYLDWGYCPVPYCAECYYKDNIAKYNGYVSKDANNKSCQQWSDYKTSGGVPIDNSRFPGGSIVNASNYCRGVFGFSVVCPTAEGFLECAIDGCPGKCEDDPDTNCTLIKDFVCLKEYTRKTLCPKTCGDCDFGLLPARTIAPPAQACTDIASANCPLLKGIICKNITAATRLCPRTCNVGCAIHTTTLPPLTTPPVNATYTWSNWGRWDCLSRDTQCFMIRRRNCSSGSPADCGDENYVDIQVCRPDACPAFTGPYPSVTQPVSSTVTSTVITSPTPSTSIAVSTVLTTPDTDQCRDNPGFVCHADNPDVLLLICADKTLAASQCPKSCGYCDCKDVFNCSSRGAKDYFCSDDTLARQFCQKTCDKCGEKSIAIVLNECNDPVDVDMCPTLDRELCICEDPDIRPLCEHFCSGQCKIKPVPDQHCQTDHFNRKRKAEILRRTLGQHGTLLR